MRIRSERVDVAPPSKLFRNPPGENGGKNINGGGATGNSANLAGKDSNHCMGAGINQEWVE